MESMLEIEYKKVISELIFGRDDLAAIALYESGTTALYALLKSFDIGSNDEVIIQAFTCSEVPSAIISTGATPIYADISIDTLTASLNFIKPLISSNTKAIVIQNTFGHVEDIYEIKEEFPHLIIIEDGAHACTEIQVDQGKLIADAAFYSTQYSKLYSTVSGGVSLCQKEDIQKSLLNFNTTSTVSSFKQRFKKTIYDYLSNSKLYYWSRSYNNQKNHSPVRAFPSKRPSAFSLKEGIREILDIRHNLSHRRQVAKAYEIFFKDHKKEQFYNDIRRTDTFSHFPIRVKNKEDFIVKAKSANLFFYDWPLRPVPHIETEEYMINRDSLHNSIQLINEVISLPTSRDVNRDKLKNILEFLNENIDDLI